MRKILLTVLFFTGIILSTSSLSAQEFEDYVSKYTDENGKKYMQPLADAFGADLNTGLFHSAHIGKIGLHIYVGVETMTAFISDDQRTFTSRTEEPFNPPQTIEAPTIFGDSQGPTVEGTGGTQYAFPGGMDVKRLPVAVPQVTVGSFLGTEGTLRFINMELGENIGKLKMFGFGIRHSISQYLLLFPIDISASFYRQNFEVGDIVEASATQFGLQASRSFSLLTVFGGIGLESSSMDISYDYGTADNPQQISFSLDAKSSTRLTLGAALKLAIVNIHASYNISSQNTLGLGIGLDI